MCKMIFNRPMISAVLFAFVLTAVSEFFEPHSSFAQEDKDYISMDFDQVDLRVFIQFISKLTKKNFIIDDNVRGKVTIVSPKKISVDEAYKVFESVLEVHGFTTVPSGEVIKIVRSVDARDKSIETRISKKIAGEGVDQLITQVIPLKNASSNHLVNILKPIVSRHGLLVDYPPTDTLIAIDYESNMNRILKIIRKLDQQERPLRLKVFYLDYSDPQEVADIVNKMMMVGKRAQKGGQPEVVYAMPSRRINAVIVVGEREYIEDVQALIKDMDKPTPKGKSKVNVVSLDYAVAEEMADVLTGLGSRKTEKGEQPLISENFLVTPDKATNSLVITADPEEFKAIQSVIDKLDVPREQVFVEAAIMEVSALETMDFGVNWQGAAELGSEGIAYGAINNLVGTTVPELLDSYSGSGFFTGVLSFPFTYRGEEYYNLGSFISAASSDNRVNIISTPQLMTMENEEAKVVIAENRPYVTSREVSEATENEYSNIEYKDVGVTLKVTPQINEKGSVRMEIYQEVSRVDEELITGDITATTPVTQKRTAETRVEVKDGQTAVIAGLIQEDKSSTEGGLPLLRKIPLLGWLFKRVGKNTVKRNLMVFITPHVVRSDREANRIYNRKRSMIDKVRFGLKGKALPVNEPFIQSDPIAVK